MNNITYEEILKRKMLLTQNIDFNDLIVQKVLLKRKGWYEILDIKRLPEHVEKQIVKTKQITNPSGEAIILVKFRKN